jgi:enoyl-CoA hydratase
LLKKELKKNSLLPKKFVLRRGRKMSFNTIIYGKDEGIGIIRLDRPKKLNALSNELFRELAMAIEAIEKDKVGVVIITGSEEVFSVGGDISELAEPKPMEFSPPYVFNKIGRLEKPVIAAVSGMALGGGCELALACDIRVAAENAVFGLTQIKFGSIPGAGGTQRLPRLIGLGKARELLFTGDTIDAQEAYRIGLVNKVVPVQSLMDETKKMALKMVRQPSVALKMTKIAVNEGINMDLQSALAYGERCFEIVASTEDRKEGMKAFMEKRPPIFKGK